MPFLRSTTIVRLQHVAGPVTLAYRHRVKTSALRYNAEQLSLCSKLDALYSSLLTQSEKKYPSSLLSSVDNNHGLFMIPDEHLEVAARYYSCSSSIHGRRSILSSSKMLLSTITTDNISSVAYTAAHSLLARMRQQSANNNEQQQHKNNGIYIHGSVGVGKSMIMDLFYSICTHGLSISMDSSLSSSSSSSSFGHYENNHVEHIETDHDENTTQYNYQPINIPTKRYHFHEFMIQIHQRIHTYKLHHPKRSDPIPPIVAQIASESRLICFDEMQIVDIADAMIMKRILTLLLELDVIIVTTSNRPPHGLYEGGINRLVFVPLIHELMGRLDVVEMMERIDYRKVKMKNEEEERLLLLSKEEEPRSDDDGGGGGNDSVTLPSYICTSNGVDDLNNDGVQQMLTMWFSKGGKQVERHEMLPVAMGRTFNVKRANTSCAWFTFNELCNNPLGAADYIAIAERFDVVIVEGVPQMSGHCYNEARRFVIFIDALYEARTKLIIAANVPMDELFLGFDATVETNDGDEEIAIPDASGDSFVVGEGGSSSSSSTTMIRTRDDKTVEWSATGRVGVSLAQLSAVKEVSYSFQRAESRLAEMSLASWGR